MLTYVCSALDFIPDEVYIPHYRNVYTGLDSVKSDVKWIASMFIYRRMFADGLP
jgi:hypothetical protein